TFLLASGMKKIPHSGDESRTRYRLDWSPPVVAYGEIIADEKQFATTERGKFRQIELKPKVLHCGSDDAYAQISDGSPVVSLSARNYIRCNSPDISFTAPDKWRNSKSHSMICHQILERG